ncbi:MAG: hypothetical protein IJF68_02245, partial [Opitutales bacterium]|nr:hypothetical protein [Opitutales bacterium]
GMAKTGVIIGVLGMVLTYAMMILLASLGVFKPLPTSEETAGVPAQETAVAVPVATVATPAQK